MHGSSDALLEAARTKLFAFDAPILLRIAGFIRLSCRALGSKPSYTQVLQDLSEGDSEWWKSCEIRPDGCLVCWDPVICQRLVPILMLHPAIMAAQPCSLQPHCLPQVALFALPGLRGG